MLTNLPVPYDLALVGAFNQEKALVGAFSVIIHHRRLIVHSTKQYFLLHHGHLSADVAKLYVNSKPMLLTCNYINWK